LIINLKAAKAIGLTIPDSFLLLAESNPRIAPNQSGRHRTPGFFINASSTE
jgi:hypothetical protein